MLVLGVIYLELPYRLIYPDATPPKSQATDSRHIFSIQGSKLPELVYIKLSAYTGIFTLQGCSSIPY
jgi:hypothetical protein